MAKRKALAASGLGAGLATAAALAVLPLVIDAARPLLGPAVKAARNTVANTSGNGRKRKKKRS